MDENPPNIEKKFKSRHHGWHWWHGISNERDSNGRILNCPRWYVVHCWTCDGKAYALGAHFQEPMDQELMGGEWGEEVIREVSKNA